MTAETELILKKLDEINVRLDKMDKRMDSIENRLEENKKEHERIFRALEENKEEHEKIFEELHSINMTVTRMETEYQEKILNQ